MATSGETAAQSAAATAAEDAAKLRSQWIEQYNAEAAARYGNPLPGETPSDTALAVSNSVAHNAAIQEANSRAQAHNAPIVTSFDKYIAGVDTAKKNAATAAATTAQNYQNTLNAAQGTAAFDPVQTLVTDGGFTQAQATQLNDWYNTQIDNQVPIQQIEEEIYQQPAVVQRYPAIAQMMKAGMAPVTIGDYQNIETAVKGMTTLLGVPEGTVTQDDITKALVNGVPASGGPDSIEGRLSAAQAWVENAQKTNPQAIADMQQYYGANKGNLIAYALTNDQGLLQNQLTSASIAGNLQQAGFSQIDKNQVLALAGTGTGANATQSEQEAGAELGLTNSRLTGTSLTQAELISANLGGSVTATGESSGAAAIGLKRAQAGAAAKFASGGNYGTGTTSTTGSASE